MIGVVGSRLPRVALKRQRAKPRKNHAVAPRFPLAREIPRMSEEGQGCPAGSEETQGVDHLVWGPQAVTLTSAATSPGIYPEKFQILHLTPMPAVS